MITIEDLRDIVVFKGFEDEMLEKLLPLVSFSRFSEEKRIFNESEEATTFYMLKSGKVLLEKRISRYVTVPLGAIKTGYSFGWSSIFGKQYTFMAICAEESDVFMIDANDLINLFDKDPALGYYVMRSLYGIMKNRMDRISDQFLKTIREHPDITTLIE